MFENVIIPHQSARKLLMIVEYRLRVIVLLFTPMINGKIMCTHGVVSTSNDTPNPSICYGNHIESQSI